MPLYPYTRMYSPKDPVLDKFLQRKKVEIVIDSVKTHVFLNCCEFNADGRFVFAGHDQGGIVYHNTYDFSFFYMETLHLGKEENKTVSQLRRIRLLPFGNNDILTCSSQGYVIYLDNFLNKQVRTCVQNGSAIEDLAVNGDGSCFAASVGSTIHVYGITPRSMSPLVQLTGPHEFTTLCYHPLPSLLLAGDKNGCVRLFDVREAGRNDSKTVWQVNPSKQPVSFVNWHRTTMTFVVGSKDRSILFFDARMPQHPTHRIDCKYAPTCMRWNPCLPDTMAVGDYGGSVYFYDICAGGRTFTGTYTCTLKRGPNLVGAALSPPDPITLTPIGSILKAHRTSDKDDQAIVDLCYHPNGHVLTTIGADKDLRFWTYSRPGTVFWDIFHRSGQGAIDPTRDIYSHNQSHRNMHDDINTAANRLNADELQQFMVSVSASGILQHTLPGLEEAERLTSQ